MNELSDRNKSDKKSDQAGLSDDFVKLLEAANTTEKNELTIFHNAVIKTLKGYQESPTKTNQTNLEAARKIFLQRKKELANKYFPDRDTGAFSNLFSVVEHLDRAGFKISKSKIYRDKDKNKIRINQDGTVSETEVRAYAATLDRKEADINDLNDIHAVKTAKEVERIEEQIARLKWERKKSMGKYILRSDFEAELAARAAVLESGFRHCFNLKVRDWIAIVNGKAEKAADFLENLNKALNEQLNSYAGIDTFQVIFKQGNEK